MARSNAVVNDQQQEPVVACTLNLSSEELSDSQVIGLNAYDFLAFLGKRVINPGGLGGRKQLLAALQPGPGTHLLEVGCGTGHAACDIAEQYGCEVTAVDVSAWMIEEARKEVRRRGLEGKVRCEVADVQKLPFPPAQFDSVLVQAVLMFVDHPKAIAEISRVLKPGGAFAGLEFSWRKAPPDPIRDGTYGVCGCKTMRIHSSEEWANFVRGGGFQDIHFSQEQFAMMSIPGFFQDEGLANCMRIMGKVLTRRATQKRMAELWTHFTRHIEYFSYTVLTGRRPLQA